MLIIDRCFAIAPQELRSTPEQLRLIDSVLLRESGESSAELTTSEKRTCVRETRQAGKAASETTVVHETTRPPPDRYRISRSPPAHSEDLLQPGAEL